MQYFRTFLILCALMWPQFSAAQSIIELTPDEEGRGPGDKGYMHEDVHPFYQELFASGKCYCHTGECRPTMWRSAQSSPSGIQVIRNGTWIDVPPNAIQPRESVPEQLWSHPVHICAYPSADGQRIIVECAIINAGM